MLTIANIIQTLGGEANASETNAGELIVNGVGSLAHAQPGKISFFTNTKYQHELTQTQASVVILKAEHAHLTTLPTIITDNPYAYFAKVSALLNPEPIPPQGVHTTASVANGVEVPASAAIQANAVIAEHVQLGENVVIGASCVIESGVKIGDNTVLDSNVTIKHGTTIGQYCFIAAGCVIGNNGFGYAEEAGKWVKIPQVGRVVIGDHVDIGANTTVDRGAIDDTVIEDGVKIDNLVQIAHNCRIGAHTVIAGCVGIAGSAVIGQHCKLGGAAMILGHLQIANHVTISPGSMITRSIHTENETYTALMPFQSHDAWLKTAANIRHLNALTDKIKVLEKTVTQLNKKLD